MLVLEKHPLHQIYIDFSDFSEQNYLIEIDLKNDLKYEKIQLETSQKDILKFNKYFIEYKRNFFSKLNSIKPLLKHIEKDVNLFLEEAIFTNKNKMKP